MREFDKYIVDQYESDEVFSVDYSFCEDWTVEVYRENYFPFGFFHVSINYFPGEKGEFVYRRVISDNSFQVDENKSYFHHHFILEEKDIKLLFNRIVLVSLF